MAVIQPLQTYTQVLSAAISGGEDDLVQALGELGSRELARLINAMGLIQQVARRRDTELRR